MSEDPLYREIILEHWQHPQNYGVLENPDIDARGTNPLCGDTMHITAQLQDDKIAEIAFEAEGCAISKASASLFTENIKDKTVGDVKALSETDVIANLGVVITPARTKCALLAYKTLRSKL